MSDEKIVVALVDEMTISTSDSVANVEVRGQSNGPGFCSAKISVSPGGVVAIAAPPNTWSPWITVASHIGKVSYTLSAEVDCDTGAIFQVRYYH